MLIWVNGKRSTTLSVADRGLQYGDGVWETIAIREHQAIQLGAHLSRLQRGLDALAIKALDIEALETEIMAFLRAGTDMVAEAAAKKHANVLKIIITRGAAGRGFNPRECHQPTRILVLHPWPDYPSEYAEKGIKVTLCETRLAYNPALAGIKHLNRLEQILARAEFDTEFQEGIVRDYDNNLIEGTMSNLFIVKNDHQMLTPALNACGIEGIARLCIMRELKKMGVALEVATVDMDEVVHAKGLFMCNSIIKIWPVRQFQQTRYNIPDSVRRLQRRMGDQL